MKNLRTFKSYWVSIGLQIVEYFQFLEKLLTEKNLDNTEAAIQRCSWEKVFWKYAANLQENTMLKCDFNEAAIQLYWSRTLAWVLSCKFAAYFQNTFSAKHLWMTASENNILRKIFFKTPFSLSHSLSLFKSLYNPWIVITLE